MDFERPISINPGRIPEFMRRDGPALTEFIRVYFEWLDSHEDIKSVSTDFRKFQDVDLVEDDLLNFLSSEFLVHIPETLKVDRKHLIKNIKDFYLAKGTERATRFLFRILFDEDIEFYYPKVDILRTSYGNWIVESSLQVVRGVDLIDLHENDILQGQISGAKARVTHFDYYKIGNVDVVDVFLSNITGEYIWNEDVAVEGEVYGKVYSSGTIRHAGRYEGTDGFLSSDKRLQDGNYYQEYSYEITSGFSLDTYKEVMENLVHPSGTKMFGRVQLNVVAETGITFDVVYHSDDTLEFEKIITIPATIDFDDTISIFALKTFDFPDMLDFTNIVLTTDPLSGLVSFEDSDSASVWKDVSASKLIGVPLQYLGSKALLIGNPVFAVDPPANTFFTISVLPGFNLTIDDTNYYSVAQIYNDNFLRFTDEYVGTIVKNVPFSALATGNSLDILRRQYEDDILLNFVTGVHRIKNENFPANFVFKNWAGDRSPLIVATGEDLLIPIPAGTYDVLYTFDDTTTTTELAAVVGVDELFEVHTSAKDKEINSIHLTIAA